MRPSTFDSPQDGPTRLAAKTTGCAAPALFIGHSGQQPAHTKHKTRSQCVMPRSAMSGVAPPISQARALVQPNTDWAYMQAPV
jgi:hypothetical protein